MVHIINSLDAKLFFSLSYDGEDCNVVALGAMQSEVFDLERVARLIQPIAEFTIPGYKVK